MSTSNKGYVKYPIGNVVLYNLTTCAHYLIGGIGIMLGYGLAWPAYLLGAVYLVFAFTQMYVIMPLTVCPSCAYRRIDDARCISGLNIVSRWIAKQEDRQNFSNRAAGPFCPNNLYLAALATPILLMLPVLFVNFSVTLLVMFLATVGLLAFRFFVIFTRVACVHCIAKHECPNAKSMGLA